jgi:hypothetical protein
MKVTDDAEKGKGNEKEKEIRSPIIVTVGHVDHGNLSDERMRGQKNNIARQDQGNRYN